MTERKNISQPPEYWAAWQRKANREKVSLSEWMARACNACISAAERKRLPERPQRGRPKEE